ncbi:uncharacterized protein [Sinocyclocheilus grahami]|uniref:uncharacterized protein n=1 Tax=Sinocyclocheilus grahami TaxID=75366 RepID=UPI0007AD68A9|nr:PREDICTED: uncharacterized protein LOC107571450 [Sinocyclocheilus grahami]
MIDKLTMHFLRPSNNGGEVLIVIYPTSNKGQAYVVFEEEEVPGVLEHNHVLELDSQFYPLDVKKMHQPKTKVKVLGGACEEAAKKISKFMNEMSSSLCTHEIDLKKLDSSQQRHIFQNAYSFQRIYSVLIRKENYIIKVVGSSKDSYDAKEKLLGREVDNAQPGHFTKSNLRRSRSLPRPKTRAREENTDLGQSPDAVDTTTVSSSSASHSRTESQLQQEVQKERGRKPTKSSTPRIRAHSSSRLQHKSQSRSIQEASSSDQQDLTPSKEVQTSRQKLPKIIPPLFSDNFFKNTKSRLRK